MKKDLAAIAFLLLSHGCPAQFAVIQDPDGNTNVRQEPDGTSAVVYTLHNDEVFMSAMLPDPDIQWLPVTIAKNPCTIICGDFDYITGYIHRSRVQFIEDLPTYTGDQVSIQLEVRPFSEAGKYFEYVDSDLKYISKINGLHFWGTDGDLPKTEVGAFHIMVFGNDLTIPEIFYTDLFDCNKEYTIYRKGDIFFAENRNSDGAGSYSLVWVFDSHAILQRFIVGAP
ncbi:MAG: hypothetical protein R2794_00345 [Chitinophagales bacterium]